MDVTWHGNQFYPALGRARSKYTPQTGIDLTGDVSPCVEPSGNEAHGASGVHDGGELDADTLPWDFDADKRGAQGDGRPGWLLP